MGLATLRRSIGMVPQSPLVLRASIGHHIDPFGLVPAQEIKRALAAAGLSAVEASAPADELSHGQHQLLALARLLLKSRDEMRLLVLDEPTSSMDEDTDATWQRAVKKEFVQ